MNVEKLVEKFEWKKPAKARPIGLSMWLDNYRSIESYPNNSTRIVTGKQ